MDWELPVPAVKPCFERIRPRWSFEPFEWSQVPDEAKKQFEAAWGR
jgi:hypothetical protein